MKNQKKRKRNNLNLYKHMTRDKEKDKEFRTISQLMDLLMSGDFEMASFPYYLLVSQFIQNKAKMKRRKTGIVRSCSNQTCNIVTHSE